VKFNYTIPENWDGHLVKNYLKHEGVSKNLLAKIKFDGGSIFVNGQAVFATHRLNSGDELTIDIPAEKPVETLIPQDYDLDIVFEDAHFLVVNKPAGVASVTGMNYPDGTMSNYVQGYLIKQGYENQKVHVVTRLDKDTSGLMLFAKHGFAHAFMDKQLQDKTLNKSYFALVSHPENLEVQGEIKQPIGRKEGSIIERVVRPDGKWAWTSYRRVAHNDYYALVDINLHTGRTHQIRVHFAYLGSPLLGDDLYGGERDRISRQALHCHRLNFVHPFLHESITIEQDLPRDMKEVVADGFVDN
jgi:23S rRNA pseudouridine1911/1915/1917 synthase